MTSDLTPTSKNELSRGAGETGLRGKAGKDLGGSIEGKGLPANHSSVGGAYLVGEAMQVNPKR